MKKNLAIMMMGLALVLSSAACGQTAATTTAAETTAAPESTAAETTAEETTIEETTEEAAASTEEEIVVTSPDEPHEQMIDISGCETFTEIVDKLPDGYGYSNETLDDTDVLLVTGSTFDGGDGIQASVNAEIYRYNDDDLPEYLGFVSSGGSATPLALYEDRLFSAGHHYIRLTTVKDGELTTVESAREEFDAAGNATYYYAKDGKDEKKVEDGSDFSRMLDKYAEAETVDFTVVE